MSARVAVTSGTFDPPTLGHLDVIARGAALFDRLVVGVATNPAKTPLFALDERLELLRGEVAYLDRVEVAAFAGLVVDFARAHGAVAILRGVRNGTDYDYEAQMAAMNRAMTGVDTVLLVAAPALQPISSTLVKQIAKGGGDHARFTSPTVAQAVAARAQE